MWSTPIACWLALHLAAAQTADDLVPYELSTSPAPTAEEEPERSDERDIVRLQFRMGAVPALPVGIHMTAVSTTLVLDANAVLYTSETHIWNFTYDAKILMEGSYVQQAIDLRERLENAISSAPSGSYLLGANLSQVQEQTAKLYWQMSDWGECEGSICGGTMLRRREAACVERGSLNVVEDAQCDFLSIAKPSLLSTCFTGSSCGWRVTDWGKCKATEDYQDGCIQERNASCWTESAVYTHAYANGTELCGESPRLWQGCRCGLDTVPFLDLPLVPNTTILGFRSYEATTLVAVAVALLVVILSTIRELVYARHYSEKHKDDDVVEKEAEEELNKEEHARADAQLRQAKAAGRATVQLPNGELMQVDPNQVDITMDEYGRKVLKPKI